MNELRVAGIATREAANRYLADHFVPQHNATFARPPRDLASAFVAIGPADLDAILCHEETRIVARDNTVSVGNIPLQISAQPGRRSCVGLQVTVRHHLDGRITISQGVRLFATFTATGEPMAAAAAVDAKTAPTAAWKTPRTRFPQPPQASTKRKRSDHMSKESGQITC